MPRVDFESESECELPPLLTISELSRKLAVDRVVITAIIAKHQIIPAGSADGVMVFFSSAIEQVQSALRSCGGVQ